MKKNVFGLGILQVFIGISAVAGGLGLALDPDEFANRLFRLNCWRNSFDLSFRASCSSLSTGLGSLVGAVVFAQSIFTSALICAGARGAFPRGCILVPESAGWRGSTGCIGSYLYIAGIVETTGIDYPQDDISRRFEYSVT
ncbi:MAG: hypothetical protein R2932_42210 [Caldilineaceae bacterium]